MRSESTETPLWLSNANETLFLKRSAAELKIALQPIVDINTGRTIAFESLVRDVDKVGFPSIEALFDHAAELDTLCQLEACLLERAISTFALLRREHWLLLFVNIDGRALRERAQIQAILDRLVCEMNLEASDICIELSERNNVLSAEQFAEAVGELRRAGYLVAIDDFGTGNSGLQMLYQSNPNFLKIDRFFVQAMQADNKKRLMVSTIVDLAHTMGIRVIAEGVETIHELHASREVRCDLAQGYLIGRPTVDVGDLKKTYAIVPANADLRAKRCDAVGIRAFLQPLHTLNVEASLVDVFKLLRLHPDQSIIPILDNGSIPHGIIRERDLKPFVYSPYGRDLLRNPWIGIGLKDFIRPIPTADVNAQLVPLLDLVSDTSQEGILITDGIKYAGVLPAAALARLANEIRLEAAVDRNPLTRLPANGAIKAFIDRAVAESRSMRALCHADLDNFKPFNDKYGFRAGDRALLLFSDLLKSLQADSDIFVGHVGGDDFFVGAMGAEADDLLNRLGRLQARFSRDVENLYAREDRDAGYIVSKDRTGKEQRFPLLSCTVAALEIPAHAMVTDAEMVTDKLAAVKVKAKSRKGSLLAVVLECRQSVDASEAHAA